MAAIYLHIPFCKRLCGYCDFFKSVKLQHMDSVLDQMELELVAQMGFITDHNIKTIYFGGGTPSLVRPERIKRLLDIIRDNYDVTHLEEVTMEVNPDDIDREYLEAIYKCGVNRLSIGIQSFDDDELKFMNRRHSAVQAIEAVRVAQSVGFDNITIDLIFGVDGFGIDVLKHSISAALSLGVQHISAYHLTIEGGTPFAKQVQRGAMKQVSDDESEVEYKLVEEALVAAGYQHYEVSNYALPGFRSRHNSSYWKGVQYLGIGAAAHSFNGEQRRYSVESIEGYLNGGAERYVVEELDIKDHYNELVMTSLRCCEGIDLVQAEQLFPKWLCEYMLDAAKGYLQNGQLILENQHLYIPTHHFLLSDAVIESLFYC